VLTSYSDKRHGTANTSGNSKSNEEAIMLVPNSKN
jgi:hypothetical protein